MPRQLWRPSGIQGGSIALCIENGRHSHRRFYAVFDVLQDRRCQIVQHPISRSQCCSEVTADLGLRECWGPRWLLGLFWTSAQLGAEDHGIWIRPTDQRSAAEIRSLAHVALSLCPDDYSRGCDRSGRLSNQMDGGTPRMNRARSAATGFAEGNFGEVWKNTLVVAVRTRRQ